MTEEESRGVVHHLISCQDPSIQFTVRDFVTNAERLISDIRSRGKLPIIVGGTCYYAYNLLIQLQNNKTENSEIKEENKKIFEIEAEINKLNESEFDEELRNKKLADILKRVDPGAYQMVKNQG